MRTPRDTAAIRLRRLQASLMSALGVTRRGVDRRRGAAILMYHRVLRDEDDARNIDPGMYVRASSFRRHLEWILMRWPIRTLGELVDGQDAPACVAITFDDGWRDNLTVAWPIMRELNVAPTIFVVRDWVARGQSAAGEFIRPDEIAALSNAGVEFGAHTVSHPHLDRLPAAAICDEMRRSREAVEQWTGKRCRLFAYPFGHHNATSIELAREHFAASVVVGGGWWTRRTDFSRIPRIAIHEDMSSSDALFAWRLAGRPEQA